MVKEIQIFVEGGGNTKLTQVLLRQGFDGFFKDLLKVAKSKGIVLRVGSRNAAFDDFKLALRKATSDTLCILLVDSEGLVNNKPWLHLNQRDKWTIPSGATDDHCHLMVQMVEGWLIADLEALKSFYGKGFQAGQIPKSADVEQINDPKFILKQATKKTSKGEYHEIQHCPKILEKLDAVKVRKASAHCDRLFTTLAAKMGATI